MVDPRSVTILGIDHVQVAAPRGCEAEARAFYGELEYEWEGLTLRLSTQVRVAAAGK